MKLRGAEETRWARRKTASETSPSSSTRRSGTTRTTTYARETVHAEFNDHPPTRFFDVGRIGPEALIEAAQEFHRGIPEFHDAPELVLVEGDRVAYLGQIAGKQEGELFGFPPTGRRMRVWGVNFFRMEDDKIIERWGQFDVLSMMQQLGLAPGPPVPEAPEEGPEYGDPRRAGREDSSEHRGQQGRLRADGRARS